MIMLQCLNLCPPPPISALNLALAVFSYFEHYSALGGSIRVLLKSNIVGHGVDGLFPNPFPEYNHHCGGLWLFSDSFCHLSDVHQV